MTDTESYWDRRDPIFGSRIPSLEEEKEEWLRDYLENIKNRKSEESKEKEGEE